MVVERLQFFYAKNNRYPRRIIVYRDGVSEGMCFTMLIAISTSTTTTTTTTAATTAAATVAATATE